MNKKREAGLSLKILRVVGLGTVLVAASIIAPRFPYAILSAALKKKFGRGYAFRKLSNSVNYLKRNHFIAYSNGRYAITPIGRKRLAETEMKELKIEKQAWDSKWRLISFDIPELQKPARTLFRRKLKQMGFYNFQRSLFVLPYPCEKEICLLTDWLKITPHVHIFVAERFRNDKKLRKAFNL